AIVGIVGQTADAPAPAPSIGPDVHEDLDADPPALAERLQADAVRCVDVLVVRPVAGEELGVVVLESAAIPPVMNATRPTEHLWWLFSSRKIEIAPMPRNSLRECEPKIEATVVSAENTISARSQFF